MADPGNSLLQAMDLHRTGQVAAAEQAYRKAIEAAPNHAEGPHMLGVLLGQAGHPAQAIECFLRAIALDPRVAEYRHNLGEAYRQLGNFPAACEAFDAALALRGDFLEASVSLGLALKAEATLSASAGHPETQLLLARAACANDRRGSILLGRGQILEAIAAYREATELDPGNASAWSNLGNVLRVTGRIVEAEVACRRALALHPAFAEAYNNLGNALFEQSRWEEATLAFEAALQIRPDMPEALHNISSGALLFLNYRPDVSPTAILAAHRIWGEGVMKRLAAPALVTDYGGSRDPERPLRVGYVSPDLREHSVSYSFEPLLANLDRQRIVPICYSESNAPDAVTLRLQALAADWRNTSGIGDRELAETIRSDGIDILVDLAGHTLGNRLPAFAFRPAPIAVSYQGYPATTGLPAIDFRLTDAIADPPGGTDKFHSEKLVRLPAGFLCYRPPLDAPEPVRRDDPDRSALTFASFNNLSKVTPQVIETWSTILNALPEARLLLKSKPFADPAMRARLIDAFTAHGVRPEQLDLRAQSGTTREHLEVYREVDVALDPFPYNGTTTTCEALWMGVPVVALAGDRHAARVGLDILTQIGLRDLTAKTTKSYVKVALALARDAAMRRKLRVRLRDLIESSPLRDEAGHARQMEAAFRDMWRSWCATFPD